MNAPKSLDGSPRRLAAATPARPVRPSVEPPPAARLSLRQRAVDWLALCGPAVTTVVAVLFVALLTAAEGGSEALVAAISAAVTAVVTAVATLRAQKSQVREVRDSAQKAAFEAFETVIAQLERRVETLHEELEQARKTASTSQAKADEAARETQRVSNALADALRKLQRYEAAVREDRQRIDDLTRTPSSGILVRAVDLDDSGPKPR